MARFRQIARIKPAGFLSWNRFSLLGHLWRSIGCEIADALPAFRLFKGSRARHIFHANPEFEFGCGKGAVLYTPIFYIEKK
jgi:hypothetical protein